MKNRMERLPGTYGKNNKSYWCGVRMTPEQREKLARLASWLGVNPSAALRVLIDKAPEVGSEVQG